MSRTLFLIFVFAFPILVHSQSLTPERVAKIKSATVRITIEGNASVGSGFFINNDGLLITCYHVIKPAISLNSISKIFAELNTGEIIEVGILDIAKDTSILKKYLAFDFCILTPLIPRHDFSFLKIGDFDKVKEGEEIYTCGYPIGIKQQFITKGIVSTRLTNNI